MAHCYWTINNDRGCMKSESLAIVVCLVHSIKSMAVVQTSRALASLAKTDCTNVRVENRGDSLGMELNGGYYFNMHCAVWRLCI